MSVNLHNSNRISIEYQKYLSHKLASNRNTLEYYLQFNTMQRNFVLPMQMLTSLISWQNPKPIHPMPAYVLGMMIIGQVATTVISLEKLTSLPFEHKVSDGGLRYKFIVGIHARSPIGIALVQCQIITHNEIRDSIIIGNDWLKQNIC
jgi:chemotaxis signal transduction protein